MVKLVRHFTVFSILGIFFYIYLFYGENGKIPELNNYYIQYIGVVLISILSSFILRTVNKQLNTILPWNTKLSFRFLVSTLFNFVILPVNAYLLIIILQLIFKNNLPLSEFIAEHYESFLRLCVLSITFGFIYSVVDFSFFSYNNYSIVQIESERQIRKQIELQFEALKTQLSPHYLFNSLNTISLLIYKDEILTEKFIRKLALTYQYILESNEKKLTSLKEEIEFIHAYTYLINVRFEESFNVEIKIDTAIEDTLIPPLSIQILLENAVKHNVLGNDDPLNVSIYNDSNYIIIENNILKKPSTQHSFKIGHNNVMNRYQYFTNKKISIDKTDIYQVKLPIITA